MGTSFEALQSEYTALWNSMLVRDDKIKLVDTVAARALSGKLRYLAVTARTDVPWPVIAIIHQMECSGDWRLSIAQGDPFDKVSVRVPARRGPFKSWEDAAVDALQIDNTDQVKVWSIERLCYELEKYNGFGSRARGIHTPYLWSFSNHYTRGKYIADHVWSETAVSQQCGAMPMLKRMMARDLSVVIGPPPLVASVPPPPPAPPPAKWSLLGAIRKLFS